MYVVTNEEAATVSYEIHLTIPEDSSDGHLIATLSARQHITPSQVVERIISQAAQQEARLSLSPTGPETALELVERLRARKKDRGAAGPRPPKATSNPEAYFGIMSGKEEFSKTMDEIIAGRPHRYGFEG